MTKTSETQNQTEQPESTAPSRRSSRKSILALSVFALGLTATAAVHTLSPSDFALLDVSSLAELLPHQKASDPIPDPVIAALKDIQSAQWQHAASLLENSSLLQQNTALLRQDSTTLASLRQSITDEQVDLKKISTQLTDEQVDVRKISAQLADEHVDVTKMSAQLADEQVDVKKISAQLADEHVDISKMSTQLTDEQVDVKKMSAQISTLIAKVDSLQSAIAREVTSSIAKGHAHNQLSGVLHKRMVRQSKPVWPVWVGGAPRSFPAMAPAPQG